MNTVEKTTHEQLVAMVGDVLADVEALADLDSAQEWADGVLECEIVGRRNLTTASGWVADSIELTITLGGPTVWVCVKDNGRAKAEGRWGTDAVTLYGRAGDGMAALVAELLDGEG